MAYQIWKEPRDEDICIFSSVAVYSQTKGRWEKRSSKGDVQEGAEYPERPGAETHIQNATNE